MLESMLSDALEMADLGGIMDDVVKDAYSQGFKDGLERAAEVARHYDEKSVWGEDIAAAIEKLKDE